MNKRDYCPNCGSTNRSHTGTYCRVCGEPLYTEEQARKDSEALAADRDAKERSEAGQ